MTNTPAYAGDGRRSCVRRLVVAALTLGVLAGCGEKRSPIQYSGDVAVSTVVSEVQLYRNHDIYRVPYPLDAEGKNLFSNAIARLDAFSKANPGQYLDSITFTKALCHEKLGNLDQAIELYGAVPVQSDPKLAESAKARQSTLKEMRPFFLPPLESSDPGDRAEYDAAAKDRAQMGIDKFKDTEYSSLAWVLAENQAVNEFLRIETQRSTLGETNYREAIEGLLKRFPDSKRVYEHWMRLGLFYEQAAREWIARAEYGKEEGAWDYARQSLDRATEIYVKVSQADGYPEKPEATARLDAVEALSRKVDQRKG